MSSELNRRTFIKQSLLITTASTLALHTGLSKVCAQDKTKKAASANNKPTAKDTLPKGKIGNILFSRLMLGGNLLTHFTHSRDLKYVYDLAAHYNTEEKILETLALAEGQGVDTLVVHTVPWVLNTLRKYRYQQNGKIKWIICPTATIDDTMNAYREQVKEIIDMGVDAIYLWGVRADQLVCRSRVDLIAKAVDLAQGYGVPSGVGAHDLKVIMECEKNNVAADFYLKTLHHHHYPSAPRPDEIKAATSEVPGYWCKNPAQVIEFMQNVDKPWIAFKVMAAGAIPPKNAFRYAFENGADHILAGMFDFEISEDVHITKTVLAKLNRLRPWRS